MTQDAPPPSAPGERPPERYAHRLEVRYGETDQMGVVHHANYLLYLEEARTAYMRALGLPYGDVERSGVGLPVRSVELRYRRPAFYEDRLRVDVWIERSRAASVTFGYEVLREPAESDGGPPILLSNATVELACMDLATRSARPFPPELVEALGLARR
ncbi:MAG: thioesterase family protein [Planctomycetota bacterium]